MFIEGVLKDIELQTLVEVLEEHLTQMVTLADDDGILIAQVAEAGKRGAKHGVGAHKTESTLAIKLGQLRLHRSDIAQDTILRQSRDNLLECLDGILHRSGIDDQFGSKLTNFVKRSKATSVVHEAQALGVYVIHRRLVLKAQQVSKEGAHLSGSEN